MVLWNAPVMPLQSLTLLSKEAEAIHRPSGLNATWLISCMWPVILATGFLSLAGSHRNNVKSSDPATPYVRRVANRCQGPGAGAIRAERWEG